MYLVDEIVAFQGLQGNMILFLYLFPLEFKNKRVQCQVLKEAEF